MNTHVTSLDELRARLSDAMKTLNLTQTDLAKWGGCSQSAVSFFLAGKRTPGAETAIKWLAFLSTLEGKAK